VVEVEVMKVEVIKAEVVKAEAVRVEVVRVEVVKVEEVDFPNSVETERSELGLVCQWPSSYSRCACGTSDGLGGRRGRQERHKGYLHESKLRYRNVMVLLTVRTVPQQLRNYQAGKNSLRLSLRVPAWITTVG
jgi:hypothetical protein